VSRAHSGAGLCLLASLLVQTSPLLF
jgi:hypothetical protein